MLVLVVVRVSRLTYELCLSLRLLRDGVANHTGVDEGEGCDQSLGKAG